MTPIPLDKILTYDIKATGPDAVARSLSGGNQQKVVLAREVDLGSKVIVFDQPTRGLDLGAMDNIHRTILNEKQEGQGYCSDFHGTVGDLWLV